MNENENNQVDMDASVLNSSTLDLRGRQSVRATFRLSEDCIDAISILAVQLGIKQKSVFDQNVFDDLAKFIEKGKVLEKFQLE